MGVARSEGSLKAGREGVGSVEGCEWGRLWERWGTAGAKLSGIEPFPLTVQQNDFLKLRGMRVRVSTSLHSSTYTIPPTHVRMYAPASPGLPSGVETTVGLHWLTSGN